MKAIKLKNNDMCICMFKEIKSDVDCQNRADYIIEFSFDEMKRYSDIKHDYIFTKYLFLLCSMHYKMIIKDKPDLIFEVV